MLTPLLVTDNVNKENLDMKTILAEAVKQTSPAVPVKAPIPAEPPEGLQISN